MIVFVDFEASSLGKGGFPVEVGWAAEDGSGEGHLIRPAPGWTEWDDRAARIHGIAWDRLLRDGVPHQDCALHLLEVLAGHDLYASAPSWDGKWLSKLLRAAGLPRHSLRLQDVEHARRRAAEAALDEACVPADRRQGLLQEILTATCRAAEEEVPGHRALQDARRELRLWRDVRHRACAVAAKQGFR